MCRYFYGKDNEFWDDMQANGVTPRRVFLYSLLGAGVAFGGNLFGVTSGVLGSLAPETSRDARLDVLFPVGGFKRCVLIKGYFFQSGVSQEVRLASLPLSLFSFSAFYGGVLGLSCFFFRMVERCRSLKCSRLLGCSRI